MTQHMTGNLGWTLPCYWWATSPKVATPHRRTLRRLVRLESRRSWVPVTPVLLASSTRGRAAADF